MKNIIFLAINLPLLLLLSTNVLADEPPKHNCTQPPLLGKMASDFQKKNIEKQTKAYRQCILKFVDEQQKISQSTTDVPTANKAHDAAESAIQELNAYIKARNDKEEGE